MTISHAASTGVSTTTGARGTTSTTVAYVGVSAGRMGVLTVCVKPSTATLPATVTDGASKIWDKVTDATGGTGTNAADTGTSRIAKYVRILDGAETGNVTVTASNSPSQVCGAMDVYSTSAGGWLTPLTVSAADTTHGTNPTGSSGTWTTALAAGDWVHVGYATDTDDATAASGHAISQTSTTFGTVTARSRVGNSDGNDGAVFTWDAPVNSGGATTSTTMNMTWAASSCGAFGGLRLREATPMTLNRTVQDTFTGTTINATDWDNWGGAQVTQNNQLNLDTTTTAGGYYGIQRQATIDIASQFIGTKLVTAGNQALASYTAYPIAIQFSTNNDAFWTVSGNVLRFFTIVASSQVQRLGVPSLPNMQLYTAIGFVSGTLHALWSHNGTSWVSEYSVANLWSGDTVGIPYIMVGTDNAEASTTRLSVDDYFTAAGTAPVSSTLDARWEVRNQVGTTLDTRWQVTNLVSGTLDARWRVSNEVVSTLDTRWAVLSSVSQALDVRWAVLSSVSAALDARWIVRNLVSNALDVRWQVRNLVSGTLDARWGISSPVSGTLDARWLVFNAVSQALDTRWQVRNLVSNALDARWLVFNNVSQALDARWQVLAAVAQTFDLRWIVRNQVGATLDMRWVSDGSALSVSSTLDTRWQVLSQVAATLDARWQVRNLVSNQLDARWLLRNVVSGVLDARWAVLSTVAATLDARWALRAEVSASLDARWTQFQLASNSLDVRWTSAGSVASSIEAQWRVFNAVSGALDARWAITSQISTPLDTRWLVRQRVTSTLQPLWVVEASEQPLPAQVTAQLTDRIRVLVDRSNIVYLPSTRIRADLGRLD